MMRAISRIPKAMMKPRRQSNIKRDATHRAFVGTLPCAVCGRMPCDAAHIRAGTDGGMGSKPSDKYCVPLCRTAGNIEGCHPEQHRVGELTFWSGAGIDPMVVAARLWAISGDHDQGVRVILRAHATARLHHAG